MNSRVPIVVILGATGTGKSKLAIQIAKKFNGEIISADSIQVYRGLDIASNKVTEKERGQVPHHMIDICKPTDRFSVMDYKNRTLSVINDIQKRERLPIIVGGTNYYVESVLWCTLFEEPFSEEGALALDRSRVTKDGENTAAKSWWLKGDTGPCKRHADAFEFRTPFESSARPTVDELLDSIELLRRQFREHVSQIERRIAISSELFGRTLYKIRSADDEEEAEVDDETSRTTDENGPDAAEFRVECVADAETILLDEFLRKWAEKLTTGATDEQLDDIWSKRTAWSILDGSEQPKEMESWKASDDAMRIRARYSDGRREIFAKLVDDLKRIMKMRVKRLDLLRILDDVDMAEYSTEELFDECRLVDEEATKWLHPNNRRKIIRTIQIYFDTGEPYTQLLQNVRDMDGASVVSPPLRYPDVCILWLQCNQIVLNERLNKRVEEMLEMGLIVELENFHKAYNAKRSTNQQFRHEDYCKGIFQSIGLKEFHDYLMLNDEQKRSNLGEELLREGVTRLKTNTRKYSKTQWRFMTNKFIRVHKSKSVPPIFALDCTDTSKWDEEVKTKAYSLVEHYLNGGNMYESEYKPIPLEEPNLDRYHTGKFYCESCSRLFIGLYQWQQHYTSKGHRKQLYQSKLKLLHQKMVTQGKPIECEPYNIFDNDNDDDEWLDFDFISNYANDVIR